MDILHRLHLIRAPSSPRKRHQPTTSPLEPLPLPRPSSSLEPSLIDVQEAYNTARSMQYERPVHTPAPPSTPGSRHHRTPSILRTLAHHPSLSALKSKSKKRKGGEEEKRERLQRLSDGLDQVPTQRTESRLGRLRKGSLKGSKSIPRSLRLSGDSSNFRSSEDVPPLPTPTLISPHPFALQQSSRFNTLPNRHSTPPKPRMLASTPEIEVEYAGESSPESVRVRMRLDVRMGSPGRPSRSEDWRPSRRQGSVISRHLSSPAPPSRSNSILPAPSPPRLSLPATIQHPHPVPLPRHQSGGTPYTDYDEDNSYNADDFVPLTTSGRTDGLEDGLDLLVREEQLPSGTPGGSKADLRLGAFVDGKRVERGAIRFFSRDTYATAPRSISPSNSESASLFPDPDNITDTSPSPAFAYSSRRSSSPFEVKLSPMVTKRMSLEAFGTSSPTRSDETDHRSMEELVEEEIAADEQYAEHPLLSFQATQLSTIKESPSTNGGSISSRFDDRINETPAHLACIGERTRHYTPLSPSKTGDLDGLPRSDESPWLPPSTTRHMSAPPSGLTQSLLNAHSEHTLALQSQIRAGETMMDVLRAEIDSLRQSLRRNPHEDKQKRDGAHLVLEKAITELQSECANKDEILSQMRTAMSENEDFFDKLQEAHDGMATRFAELEEENAKLQAEAELSAEKLRASSHEGREAEKRIRHLEEANEKLCAALDGTRVDFSKLQTDKAQAEAQLETTNDEYTSVLAAHDGELQAFRKVVAQKDDVISNLELRIRDIISEHAMELIAQGAARKELLRQLADKDGMISHLRDKLQTARFEYDEAKCLVQREIVELQNELEARRREAGEKDRVIRATQERMARGEAERQGWEEERAELLEVIEAMRDELRNSNVGQGQVTALLKQLETARREVETLHADLQHAQERLEIQHSSFALQDVELGELRRALDEVGDALTSALESSSHQSKEAERTAARLRQEVADLQAQIAADQRALMDAITTRELEKSVSSDARSRLETYLAEIDRLKVVEARLEAQVEDLQRRSAMEEVDKLEMGKQVSRLEEDKELLNVALDSKQTELVLLQRQLGQLGVARPGSTTPRTQRLAASTSRVPQTPCNVAGTPAPRRLSTSTAGSAMKSARRESSVVSNSSFIRPRQSSATRAVLGSSTRHNRTPEKARSGAQKDGGATTTASKIRSPSVGLRRQSSLPVLASHGALSGPMSLRRVTSLVEEEEGVDAVL